MSHVYPFGLYKEGGLINGGANIRRAYKRYKKNRLKMSWQETNWTPWWATYRKKANLIKHFYLFSTCKIISCLFPFEVQCSTRTLVSWYGKCDCGRGLNREGGGSGDITGICFSIADRRAYKQGSLKVGGGVGYMQHLSYSQTNL